MLEATLWGEWYEEHWDTWVGRNESSISLRCHTNNSSSSKQNSSSSNAILILINHTGRGPMLGEAVSAPPTLVVLHSVWPGDRDSHGLLQGATGAVSRQGHLPVPNGGPHIYGDQYHVFRRGGQYDTFGNQGGGLWDNMSCEAQQPYRQPQQTWPPPTTPPRFGMSMPTFEQPQSPGNVPSRQQQPQQQQPQQGGVLLGIL